MESATGRKCLPYTSPQFFVVGSPRARDGSTGLNVRSWDATRNTFQIAVDKFQDSTGEKLNLGEAISRLGVLV
jgi:hypothetical protein